MKKLFLTIAMSAVWVVSAAQTYDTIYNKAPNGYYNRWYDTCDFYVSGSPASLVSFSRNHRDSTRISVISKFTPEPIMITGGIIMVSIEPPPSTTQWFYDRVKPEYIMLYQYDAAVDSMVFIDSARWDTVTPKIMKFPKGIDTARWGFLYCYGYEAKFKSPVMVDSTFYMGGTHNNNIPLPLYGMYMYEPVYYRYIVLDPSQGCPGDTTWQYNADRGWYDELVWINNGGAAYGGVIPTMDTFRLEVATSDSTRGTTSGSGTFLNMSRHWIEAAGVEGYRFAHWNDGNTDNPREVRLTQDTLFTAYFVEVDQVWVDARSNDNSRGTVTGGGVYYEGTSVWLTAIAQGHNKFVCWDDSVADNPRLVVLTQDTLFTALFVPLERYSVEAAANDRDRGHVEGGGEYYEGDTVTLTAVPWMLYGFLQWDDGDTANPRQFVVTQDTSFTAVFVSREGIEEAEWEGSGFRLVPNPASSEVRCVMEGKGFAGGTLSVTDAAGRTVLRKELPRQTQSYTFRVSDYPAGTYYVTLTTPTGTSTRKLIVE